MVSIGQSDRYVRARCGWRSMSRRRQMGVSKSSLARTRMARSHTRLIMIQRRPSASFSPLRPLAVNALPRRTLLNSSRGNFLYTTQCLCMAPGRTAHPPAVRVSPAITWPLRVIFNATFVHLLTARVVSHLTSARAHSWLSRGTIGIQGTRDLSTCAARAEPERLAVLRLEGVWSPVLWLCTPLVTSHMWWFQTRTTHTPWQVCWK
mmetsp:Transcript_38206/g.81450  ORF Transcript_38206/g.81450 Transcript_38206/m.81450 type:complete len:206 (-) Transcript_38206:346-963(-)